MMQCEHPRGRLGPYVDGELTPHESADVERHLAGCAACRAEVASLRALASDLAADPEASVPSALWTAIEQRLAPAAGGQGIEPRASTLAESAHAKACGTSPAGRLIRLRRAPWAMAAAVALAVSLGLWGLIWSGSPAQASTIDFSVLLDALPLDAKKAFRRFLVLYDAREGTPAKARRHAPELSFDLPDVLPCGFRLQTVHLIRVEGHAGVAATYGRNGEFLGAVFHRPVEQEDFGTHRDYPCVIGKHRGHMVQVGEWKLVHLTDPTTCHCVLSRLDERTELADIMAAVAP